MVSETATIAVLDADPTTLTVPLYVPAARPDGFAVTVTVPGVVPLDGLTVTKAGPDTV
jgi:hypothetical protein